jgi:hypothetical protein
MRWAFLKCPDLCLPMPLACREASPPSDNTKPFEERRRIPAAFVDFPPRLLLDFAYKLSATASSNESYYTRDIVNAAD